MIWTVCAWEQQHCGYKNRKGELFSRFAIPINHKFKSQQQKILVNVMDFTLESKKMDCNTYEQK